MQNARSLFQLIWSDNTRAAESAQLTRWLMRNTLTAINLFNQKILIVINSDKQLMLRTHV